jgi:bacterioferritin-associated ferredoxin
MIVCVCHNVSDKAIRRAVDAGATSVQEIRAQLNVGSCCGKCMAFAKTLVRAHLEDQPVNTTEVRRIATAG